MITRFALFEGTVKPGQTDAFRAAVLENILPKWKNLPGALDVRVAFTEDRDAGAPEIPLILAINYPDRETVETALASPEREEARKATEAVLARHFDGRIHHHVTLANEFPL